MQVPHATSSYPEHWMALEGGVDGAPGGGLVHESFRRDRGVGSRAAAEHR